jgi:hypothetical protein
MADSRDMYVVHSALRREFPAAAALVRTVAAGDGAAASRVADHVLLLTSLLNLHHTGEDRLVWPKLLERGPDEIAPLVETMERQHEVVHAASAAVEERAVVWRRTAEAADRDPLAAPEHVAGLKAVIPGPAWFVLSRLGPRAYARYARRIGLDRISLPA